MIAWSFATCMCIATLSGEIPAYQGKSVYQWLEENEGGFGLRTLTAFERMGPSTLPYLTAALQRTNILHIRTQAAWVLAKSRLDGRGAITGLVECAHSENLDLRLHATFALARMGPGAQGAVGALIRWLDPREQPIYQDAALFILGRVGVGAKAAMPEVERYLTNQSSDFRDRAAQTLLQIDPARYAGQFDAQLREWLDVPAPPLLRNPRGPRAGPGVGPALPPDDEVLVAVFWFLLDARLPQDPKEVYFLASGTGRGKDLRDELMERFRDEPRIRRLSKMKRGVDNGLVDSETGTPGTVLQVKTLSISNSTAIAVYEHYSWLNSFGMRGWDNTARRLELERRGGVWHEVCLPPAGLRFESGRPK
jgi:hypothetical protein